MKLWRSNQHLSHNLSFHIILYCRFFLCRWVGFLCLITLLCIDLNPVFIKLYFYLNRCSLVVIPNPKTDPGKKKNMRLLFYLYKLYAVQNPFIFLGPYQNHCRDHTKKKSSLTTRVICSFTMLCVQIYRSFFLPGYHSQSCFFSFL